MNYYNEKKCAICGRELDKKNKLRTKTCSKVCSSRYSLIVTSTRKTLKNQVIKELKEKGIIK